MMMIVAAVRSMHVIGFLGGRLVPEVLNFCFSPLVSLEVSGRHAVEMVCLLVFLFPGAADLLWSGHVMSCQAVADEMGVE